MGGLQEHCYKGDEVGYLHKRRTFEILESAQEGDTASRLVDAVIITFIAVSVLLVILESVESIYSIYKSLFMIIEALCVIVFTIEYVLRFWCCSEDSRYGNGLRGRMRYAVSPMALVDLVAILPFYLMFIPFLPLSPSFVNLLRLARMFRLLKLSRYSESLQMIIRVMNRAREELFIAFVVIAVVIIMVSTVMYYVENEAQEAAGKDQFSSIPMSMYWGAVTVSTVGYGDAVPLTNLGRFLAGFLSVLGIGMFAMPTAILSHEFMKEVQTRRKVDSVCPHCGERIEHPFTRQSDRAGRSES